jgi:hypothetical protein
MRRNFEPMRKQVEAWQRFELTDVTAKVVIYEAFVEGRLEPQPAQGTHLCGVRNIEEIVSRDKSETKCQIRPSRQPHSRV